MAITPKQMAAKAVGKSAEAEQQPADDDKDKKTSPAEEPKQDEPAAAPVKEPEAESTDDDKKSDPVAASWGPAFRSAGLTMKAPEVVRDPWKQ